jgi:hypothetical protein
MNNWFKHKYICNLTKESHSVLTNELNFVVTNVKFVCLLQSLVYHFFFKNDDEFLMCIISKDFGDNNESCYRCSFLIYDIDGLITKNLTKESKIVWLVFKNDENDTSECGFRFNLKECKNYYDEIKQFVNFDEVHTIKDIPIEGAEVSFNDSIKKHCKAFMTDDLNKCLFIYNDDEVLL